VTDGITVSVISLHDSSNSARLKQRITLQNMILQDKEYMTKLHAEFS